MPKAVFHKHHQKKHPLKEAVLFCLLTLLSCTFLLNFVNLTPQVDNDFFFSSDDPQFQSEEVISHLFERKDTQLIMSASGPILNRDYFISIKKLTNKLLSLPGIISVKSLASGPTSLSEAIKSPLWRRILISDDQNSSNLIIIIEDSEAKHVVLKIEELISKYSSKDFQLRMSGLPYVVELIRRHLLRDIKLFTLMAIIIFGLAIAFIFRSLPILIGTLTSCVGACIWTLMIIRLAHIKIGLLTANLGTIIFVLTLSHIIFLTYNWQHLIPRARTIYSVDKAVKFTLPASFWSMLTTLLGFLSLLFVPAKPLRELGSSGAIGSVIAIVAAYGIYPTFLKLVKPSSSKKDHIHPVEKKIYSFLDRKKFVPTIIITALLITSFFGLKKIDTDPSLISYFSEQSEITKGLKYIDINGGSSPLMIAVRSPKDTKLNTTSSYKKLWKLQEDLEKHPAVGTIISLPVLMAEAKRAPLAFLLSWEWLFNILEKPEFDRVAKSFVSADRQHGLFLLRMNELNRSQPRLIIIDEIKRIVENNGFMADPIGGIYSLQGHMARLVTSSLITGLGKLLFLFAIISFIVSRSWRIACAMTITICIIPTCILGFIGLFSVPLDIISAPASNIAIAMGIDAMIHMVKARRYMNKGRKSTIHNWYRVRVRMRHPILTSMCIICAGFSIFSFSSFPPTQRFGCAIMLGTIVAAFTALYVMPFITTNLRRFIHA